MGKHTGGELKDQTQDAMTTKPAELIKGMSVSSHCIPALFSKISLWRRARCRGLECYSSTVLNSHWATRRLEDRTYLLENRKTTENRYPLWNPQQRETWLAESLSARWLVKVRKQEGKERKKRKKKLKMEFWRKILKKYIKPTQTKRVQ